MKYTSLSHWNTVHNVQQNWNSVEEWQDYCEEDSLDFCYEPNSNIATEKFYKYFVEGSDE